MNPGSSGKRYVFAHLPRTAGTSVTRLLAEVFSPQNVSPLFPARVIGADEARQLDAYWVIAGHISWLDMETHFPERRYFTILRDPIERCMSIYGYYRQQTGHPLIPLRDIRGEDRPEEATSLARQLGPDDFFQAAHPVLQRNLDNRMVWQLGDHARAEQRAKISPEEALRRALRNLDRFAFVGFFHRLDRDLPRLLRALGVEGDHAVPLLNRRAERVDVGDLSPATLRTVKRLTELDRRLYDAALAMHDRLGSGT